MKEFWLDTTKITDGELADLIHELNNELGQRIMNKPEYRGFKGQLKSALLRVRSALLRVRSALLRVRSWSSSYQANMKDSLGIWDRP